MINALELEIFLGWPSEERIRKQIISLDIEIQFDTIPKACDTDNLKDTVCYRELIESLRAKTGDRKFHLIEHVTVEIHEILRSLLPPRAIISVNLTKHPQIQGLGSVTFNYRDEV
jgi:dihydroneopterin aldolase